MKLIIIAAVAPDNAIGCDGELLFHLPADLKRFKSLTMGWPIIMGRKTFESFPRGPLPGRRNIVISHNKDFHPDGAEVSGSLSVALEAVKDSEKVFVIGGGEIYRQTLPLADELDLTKIITPSPSKPDTFFPDYSKWEVVEESGVEKDEKTGVEYQFLKLVNPYKI